MKKHRSSALKVGLLCLGVALADISYNVYSTLTKDSIYYNVGTMPGKATQVVLYREKQPLDDIALQVNSGQIIKGSSLDLAPEMDHFWKTNLNFLNEGDTLHIFHTKPDGTVAQGQVILPKGNYKLPSEGHLRESKKRPSRIFLPYSRR